MGWIMNNNPTHLQDFINNLLYSRDPMEAYLTPRGTELRKAVKQNLAAPIRWENYIELWYRAKSAKGINFIGLCLIDCDRLKPNLTGELLEQKWMMKEMDNSVGPAFYGCPIEWLKDTPIANKHDWKWRKALYAANELKAPSYDDAIQQWGQASTG